MELSDDRPRPFLFQKATEGSPLVAARQAKGFRLWFETLKPLMYAAIRSRGVAKSGVLSVRHVHLFVVDARDCRVETPENDSLRLQLLQSFGNSCAKGF